MRRLIQVSCTVYLKAPTLGVSKLKVDDHKVALCSLLKVPSFDPYHLLPFRQFNQQPIVLRVSFCRKKNIYIYLIYGKM